MWSGEESGETIGAGVAVLGRFFLLLMVGFVLVFIGIMVVLVAAVLSGCGSASAGAVIFIGPFPIVIGVGLDVTWIVLFSVILAVISVVVFLVMNRRLRRFSG